MCKKCEEDPNHPITKLIAAMKEAVEKANLGQSQSQPPQPQSQSKPIRVSPSDKRTLSFSGYLPKSSLYTLILHLAHQAESGFIPYKEVLIPSGWEHLSDQQIYKHGFHTLGEVLNIASYIWTDWEDATLENVKFDQSQAETKAEIKSLARREPFNPAISPDAFQSILDSLPSDLRSMLIQSPKPDKETN